MKLVELPQSLPFIGLRAAFRLDATQDALRAGGGGARLMNLRSGGQAPRQASWRAIALPAFFLLIFGTVGPAAAQFHVAQPDVVKGEAVVGDHAAAYSGPRRRRRSSGQGHEVEAIYDFTDRWELVAKGLLL